MRLREPQPFQTRSQSREQDAHSLLQRHKKGKKIGLHYGMLSLKCSTLCYIRMSSQTIRGHILIFSSPV